MPRVLNITGEYPPDWKQISDATWAAAGHRCIRCGHPFRKGEHGKGEWSPCDAECRHGGPLAVLWPDGRMVHDITGATALQMVNMNVFHDGKQVVAQWRVGTVHHFDGDKGNCVWWNLMALCQRCHLQVQGKVNPETPYFLEHTGWAKPYVAGFYAFKYEDLQLTRGQVEARMEQLLNYERMA